MNTTQTVTGILLLINSLEPSAIELIKSLLTSTQGMSVAEIAAAADSAYNTLGTIAKQELGK